MRVEWDNTGEIAAFYPTVLYRSTDGQELEFVATPSTECRVNEGDRVWVYLDGKKPYLYDPMLSSRIFFFCLAVGLFVILMGCDGEIHFNN